MNDIKEFVDKYVKLLPIGTSISFTEAERRAGEFLNALAYITDCRHLLSGEKIKLESVKSMTYAEELSKSTGKTVLEKESGIEASAAYIKAREDLESIENDLNYLKAYWDLFMNGHIFYRTMAKGENV